MASLTTPFRPSNIATGLVGYWKFNNNSNAETGTNLTDGTAGPTYTATDYWKSGEYSADFEAGSSQYLTGGDILDMDGKSFSVSLWVKPETISSTMLWVSKGNVGASGWGFGITADGVNLWCYDQLTLYATLPSNGRWHHYVATYNNSTTVVNIYLDGNLVKSAANTGTIAGNATAFIVGANNGGANYFWDGLIKDLAIWSSANTSAVLTPIQIKSLALGVDLSVLAYRPNNVSTQPTHWWKLNEVSGNRADSVATNPLTLTDNNTVLSSSGYIEGVGALMNDAEYLSVAHDSSFDFDADFTVNYWIKMSDYSLDSGQHRTPFSRGQSTIAGTFLTKICSGSDGVGGAIRVNFSNDGDIEGTIPAITGAWTMVTLKREGSTVTLYIDGVANGTLSSSDNINNNSPLVIGAIFDGTGNLNAGSMQDVAIWKGYALTAAEIKSLACALPIQQQGIVSYWDMNGADGAGETDRIGDNDLTHTVGSGTIGSVAGMVSTARDFEDSGGENQSLEIANGTQVGLNFQTEFFLCAWVKFETSAANNFVFSKLGTSGNRGYDMYLATSGDVMKLRTSVDGTALITSTATTACVDGTWYFVCGNFDMVNQSIWINAISEDSDAQTGVFNSTADFKIGAAALDGVVDEALACKRYFRPEEIKAIYLKGLNGKEAISSERGTGGSNVGNSTFLLMF